VSHPVECDGPRDLEVRGVAGQVGKQAHAAAERHRDETDGDLINEAGVQVLLRAGGRNRSSGPMRALPAVFNRIARPGARPGDEAVQ
jgi:hypothetical protein